MVRNYIRKTKRQSWSEENLKLAIKELLKGKKIVATAKKFGIPRATLHGYFIKCKDGQLHNFFNGKKELKKGFHTRQIFTKEQEKFIYDQVINSEEGFTSEEVRRLAFNYAEQLGLKHKFKKDLCLAGQDWFRGFIKRHPELSLKKSGANELKSNAEAIFFTHLQSLYTKYNFEPQDIYNFDKIGISCNQKKSQSQMILAKGKSQIDSQISIEKGMTVTACICFSASGTYIPPLLIFPQKDENFEYLQGKQYDAWALFNETGYMDEQAFAQWLHKFIYFSNASISKPVLLLMDGNATHMKNLEKNIKLAQENGIIVLCFPSHCTNKMQPLDVSYTKLLSDFYLAETNCWMRNHPQSKIDFKDIFSIFTPAFLNVSTSEIAIEGFKKTGIFPYNPDIFSDANIVTDAQETGSNDNVSTNTNTVMSIENIPKNNKPNSENGVLYASSSNTQQTSETLIPAPVNTNPMTIIEKTLFPACLLNTEPASDNYITYEGSITELDSSFNSASKIEYITNQRVGTAQKDQISSVNNAFANLGPEVKKLKQKIMKSVEEAVEKHLLEFFSNKSN